MTIERPMFPPVNPTRRRLLTIAAAGSIAGFSPAIASALPDDPIYAAIERHKAACGPWNAAIDVRALFPEGPEQWEQRDELDDAVEDARKSLDDVAIDLINTAPTTLAGIAAVLRFANEIEDGGMEWPDTDAIGPEGWHYQLRATMAAAIEALIEAQAGKAVRA